MNSGWIKFEKDLRTDIRVLRMSRTISNAGAYHPVTSVTLVLGGLAQVWMYADSFAREDDTLELTTSEIDEIAGIQGFAAAMPAEWLEVLDAHTIKLPGFHAHNGTEAKRKALTAKRVSKHRAKNRQLNAALDVQESSKSNDTPLLDQTREDYTRVREESLSVAAPPCVTPLRTRRKAREEDPEFLEFSKLYPKRAGNQPWDRALKQWRARIGGGYTAAQMLDGARRYAQFCLATGKVGTEYVQMAATFLGPGRLFMQAWALPATAAEVRLGGNVAAFEDAERELFDQGGGR